MPVSLGSLSLPDALINSRRTPLPKGHPSFAPLCYNTGALPNACVITRMQLLLFSFLGLGVFQGSGPYPLLGQRVVWLDHPLILEWQTIILVGGWVLSEMKRGFGGRWPIGNKGWEGGWVIRGIIQVLRCLCRRLIVGPLVFDYGNLLRLSGKPILYVQSFFYRKNHCSCTHIYRVLGFVLINKHNHKTS